MKFNRFTLLFICLFIPILNSCIKPGQNNIKERYIVTSRNLNIRSDPSQLSRIIGTLSKGDTIIALASDKYWIMITFGDQSGFISNAFLQKLKPLPVPPIFTFIDSHSNWKTLRFWVVTIILVILWILISTGVTRYENYLKRMKGISTKGISISPLIFFVSGILTAVLYLFWKEQVIEYLFYHFSFIPHKMGIVAWTIWGQILALLSAMAIDAIGSIYKSGLIYGFLTFLIEQIENLAILTTTLFLTISLFLFAIIVLTIFFTMQYISMVTENQKSITGIFTGR